MNVFRCGNYEMELSKRTYIMGILNVTPDSFSDGGKWLGKDRAIERALEIEYEGADILDIGAQSTRPGFVPVCPSEEIDRLYHVLREIKDKINIPVSVDTFYYEVAQVALDLGVNMINNVYGVDDRMLSLYRKTNCGIVINHYYSGGGIKEYFEKMLVKFKRSGVDISRICFDPGIGFSKNYDEDIDIIRNIKNYKVEGQAFMIGVSRKRVIGRTCGIDDVSKRQAGSISAGVIASIGGADILRVHDVKESVQAIRMADKIFKDINQEGDDTIGQDYY